MGVVGWIRGIADEREQRAKDQQARVCAESGTALRGNGSGGAGFRGPAAAATDEQLPEGAEKLSAEGRVEAEARFQQIMSQYGSRFDSEEQKRVRDGCYSLEGSLERLRAFHLENGDAPAVYLKPLLEREKKPQSAPAAGAAPAAAAKNPDGSARMLKESILYESVGELAKRIETKQLPPSN